MLGSSDWENDVQKISPGMALISNPDTMHFWYKFIPDGNQKDTAFALVYCTKKVGNKRDSIVSQGSITLLPSINYVHAKMKIWTNGKYLWARTIGSTIVGEGANTFIFYTIALYGILPNNILVASILSGWFIKTLIEIVFTPVTCYVITKLKKIEDEDYFDKNTNFNPFIIKS
jgi:hypothetical protein